MWNARPYPHAASPLHTAPLCLPLFISLVIPTLTPALNSDSISRVRELRLREVLWPVRFGSVGTKI